MARLEHVEAGRLDIGLVSTAKSFILPLLARLLEEHPRVETRMQVCSNPEQTVALLRGKRSTSR